MTLRSLFAAFVFLTLVPPAPRAQSAEDRAAVRQAALDYIEGFYEGDASKLRRSIRPEATKYGFFVARGSRAYTGDPMSFDQMIAYADRVKAGGNGAPAGAPKEVIVLDVLDQTAAAKIVAWWGTDYLHLAKYDGKWMILHVLWQSPAPG